ncbi:MAG: hypothetical protein AAFW82_11300 [Pseudomonadota bacterium]
MIINILSLAAITAVDHYKTCFFYASRRQARQIYQTLFQAVMSADSACLLL